jgi:hypothetical protein
MKFQLKHKSLIIIMLFISVCAFTNKKPLTDGTRDITITQDTIPEIIVSSKKEGGYTVYLKYCNEIVIDTILQTGYLDFDTLRVSSIPENKLHLGKPIIKSLQISKELANIIVMDTIWNLIEAPEYRSTWEYYILAKHPMPAKEIVKVDYSNKIIVTRLKEYLMKRSKPLPKNEWEKYIKNKSGRNSPTEQYF